MENYSIRRSTEKSHIPGEKLKNKYGARFAADKDLNLDMPVTGGFKNEPLHRVLYLLERSTDLKFRTEGEEIMVSRQKS